MTEAPCYHLFVYGSLRKGFNSPAYSYISQHFDLLDDCTAQGKLYDMGDFAAAVSSNEIGEIKGELYVIRQKDEFSWAIAQLDDYEGITASYDEIPEYYRDLVTVRCANGNTLPAWVYWYAGNTEGKPIIPSGDIFDFIRNRFPS